MVACRNDGMGAVTAMMQEWRERAAGPPLAASWPAQSLAKDEWRIHYGAPGAAATLAEQFRRRLLPLLEADGVRRETLFVCIGTDRSTGDALGPLVGSLLLEGGLPESWVVGTLASPVHATNMGTVLTMLRHRRPRPVTVAIDACLGRADNIGMLAMGAGALRPGAGVKKELPPVGDLYITGNVNVGGFMEYFVLQNTRLSLVMDMARVIASGLLQALSPLVLDTSR